MRHLTDCVSITWLSIGIQKTALPISHAITCMARTYNLVLFSWHWIFLKDTDVHSYVHTHAHTHTHTHMNTHTHTHTETHISYLKWGLASCGSKTNTQDTGWWKGQFALFQRLATRGESGLMSNCRLLTVGVCVCVCECLVD